MHMDAKELRQKSPQELQALLVELRASVRDAEWGGATRQSPKVRELRRFKRTIARVLTLLSQTQPSSL